MSGNFDSYKYGEGTTSQGQVVQFTAPSDEFQLASDALGRFRTITIPSSRTNVEHGGYGRYSRYNLEQVDYGGGQNEAGGGYYEILNILDAPDGRCPVVSHGYYASGEHVSGFFAEWESVEAAKDHWDKTGRSRIVTLKSFEDVEDKVVPGLIRTVDTGYLSPWFYATGNASLVEDYAFPEHLAQDPTYTFGRQFLVPKESEKSGQILRSLKTCMGCAVEERSVRKRHDRFSEGREGQSTKSHRVVQWHDGTVTELSPSTPSDLIPTALTEEDAWVTDAQRRFVEMLSGQTLGFEVSFADGGKFVGKYVPPPESPKPMAAGNYYVTASLDDGTAIEGWVDFTPTTECPTLALYVKDKLNKEGKSAVTINVGKESKKPGGIKWQGVYHKSLPDSTLGSPESD